MRTMLMSSLESVRLFPQVILYVGIYPRRIYLYLNFLFGLSLTNVSGKTWFDRKID